MQFRLKVCGHQIYNQGLLGYLKQISTQWQQKGKWHGINRVIKILSSGEQECLLKNKKIKKYGNVLLSCFNLDEVTTKPLHNKFSHPLLLLCLIITHYSTAVEELICMDVMHCNNCPIISPHNNTLCGGCRCVL